ncbi:hypothetical protein EVAR_9687_1 [Eumeta japonica]|uniref:Uncharacterized protein n=1 Tax=Eumeta variegata TaxID=151549 RepID=A0A4C1YB12_EUMVA|nr:hypothetical protein EVAR_9687_1 [Eumeta japonica]
MADKGALFTPVARFRSIGLECEALDISLSKRRIDRLNASLASSRYGAEDNKKIVVMAMPPQAARRGFRLGNGGGGGRPWEVTNLRGLKMD